MIERRISEHRWNDLDEDEQHQIKRIVRRYASDFGFDFEFQYYWMRFTPENWLLANLADTKIERQIT